MSSLREETKLKKDLYRQTWAGEHFGPRGAIALGKKLYRQTYSPDHPEPLIGLASTYYSAAGNAWSKISYPLGPLWLFRAFWCLLRAFCLSRRFERMVGINQMTADQLYIYASILFETKVFARKALTCITNAMEKPDLGANAAVLLFIKRGEIHNWFREPGIANICYREAEKLVDQTPATTQVRYWRSLASHNFRKGNRPAGLGCLRMALQIAEANDLRDQVAKLRL